MKIRTDFVTNSSSSSFIVSSYENVLNELYDLVLEISDVNDDTYPGEFIATKEELEEYFLEYYGSSDSSILEIFFSNNHLRELYIQMLKSIEENKPIFEFSLGYSIPDEYENEITEFMRSTCTDVISHY